jgi:beta-lactamase regulating signal transducer with metallopeptidase domain
MSGLPAALIDALLKGSLLFVLAAVVTRLLRHRSAAARHAVWTAALLAQLALPVLSAELPSWDVPLLPVEQAESMAPPSSTSPAAESQGAPERGSPLLQALPSARSLLGLLWIIGGIALLARVVVGMAAVARLARRATEVVNGPWHSLTRHFTAALRIRRPIRLLRSDRLSVPVTWGVRHPTLLLPAEADEWSAERRGLVLIHELAHIKRLDALTQLLAHGALALFWINPLLWIAMRQMAAERERACDDYVLRCGAVASAYAEELLEIVRSLRRSPGPALAALALALARRSDFEGRMLAILNPRVSRRALDRQATLVLAALALLLVVPLAAFRPVPRPAARQATPSAVRSIARGVPAYEERQVPAMMLRDTVRPHRAAPRHVPTTHRPGSTDWKRKTVAFELLPKTDSTSIPGADVNSVPAWKRPGGGPTVCVSFSLASITKHEGKPVRGDAAAFRAPPPEFHWTMSDPDLAARCAVTVQVMQTAKTLSLPTRRLEFILAWEGNWKAPSSAEEIELFLRAPELLKLLQYLAPLRES